MPRYSFMLNGERVDVDVDDDLRLLWVLRDVLGVTGPKYGCGIEVCQACTSHINGKAFNPCAVKVSDVKKTDRVTTIEGLADTVEADLHPMQEAWLDLRRLPVRLLPTRANHGRRRPRQSRQRPQDHRRRHRQDPQHLPLRYIPAHPGRDQGRCKRKQDEGEMTTTSEPDLLMPHQPSAPEAIGVRAALVESVAAKARRWADAGESDEESLDAPHARRRNWG